MKNYKYLFWIISFGIVISCSSGDEEDRLPDENPDHGSTERCDEVVSTLSANVLPIINNNCAISGCHISGGQFPDFTNRDNIISNATLIRTQTESGAMPASESGLTLTTQQKDAIFCWVASGATNN